jgi:hypothetical protein
MDARKWTTAAIVAGLLFASVSTVFAQDDDDTPAITARVHGTFVDRQGGAGVLSGDMYIVRFVVRTGGVTAVGRIAGSLADSEGRVLGLVGQELELPVGRVESTCNQLRLELGSTEADILQTRVRFDRETAGYDSRDGATPKALDVLCAAGEMLRGKPAPADVVKALNRITAVLKTKD